MSVLLDYGYLKYRAMAKQSPGLDQVNFEGLKFFEDGAFTKLMKWLRQQALLLGEGASMMFLSGRRTKIHPENNGEQCVCNQPFAIRGVK